MIVTRNWLDEWLDLSNIKTEEIVIKLSEIGLEVGSVSQVLAPRGAVVGKILEIAPHHNSDKLRVCKIDIGSEILQIVTNDQNVNINDFVPLATVGTMLKTGQIATGNLRGIDSFGMLLATEEFGLPRISTGVTKLDNSIGELIIGRELSEYKLFNDTIIEVELTPNRGDCLSIHGIARDLSTAFNREIYKKSKDILFNENNNFINYPDFNLSVLSFDNQQDNLINKLPLKIAQRLILSAENITSNLSSYLKYASILTGVIFKEIDLNLEKIAEPIIIDEVLTFGDSQIGINSQKATNGGFIEVSYVEPNYISDLVFVKKLKTDGNFYNSSRGSEPDINFGIEFLSNLLNIEILNNWQKFSKNKIIETTVNKLAEFTGLNLEINRIEQIVKKLGFEIESNSDSQKLKITVPQRRPDISNWQDISEELLRIIGIEKVESRPFIFGEKRRDNQTSERFKLKSLIRSRAMASGFSETIIYLFGHELTFKKYGFETISDNQKLLNPIIDTMDTLRPTMTIGLLEAVERNLNFGKNRVALFEIGRIFNSDRSEREIATFIFSGDLSSPSIENNGKPAQIYFNKFAESILSIVGADEVREGLANSPLHHPYQTADIYRNNLKIGVLYKLNERVARDFKLKNTYLAEIEIDKIELEIKQTKAYSKYQSSWRDLSLVIKNEINYSEIKNAISELKIETLTSFAPISIFKLPDGSNSLTIRFYLQSMEKTLSETDLNGVIEQILKQLSVKLNLELRN